MNSKPYKVDFKKSAKKELEKLSSKIQDRIFEVLKILALNPYTDILDIKKIKGLELLFRVRVGDYRVVYELHKDILVIVVIKIGDRKEVYRKF